MARKPHQRGTAELPALHVEARARKALQEGRTQQALEFAKQLYKHEPSEQHRNLLRQAYLERARQLQKQGNHRDAATVYENLLNLAPTDAEQLVAIACGFAIAGQVKRALALADGLAGQEAGRRIVLTVVDQAVCLGSEARQQLPPSLHADYDAIARAFAESEAGRDEAAREALQGIGLQSPFLEWKILLRGLISYYAKEDARALENWQRLHVERLPARLAAPLRCQIDPSYRDLCAPAVQAAMQRTTAQRQGDPVLQPLRQLRAALANRRQLVEALRIAAEIVPRLRQDAADVVPRLASCFYWAIVDQGLPNQVSRFQRVFGAPLDDPQLERMVALQSERLGDRQKAHESWRQFDQTVSQHAEYWGQGASDRSAVVSQIRALIWSRMGQNAASAPDPNELPFELPPFLKNHPRLRRALSPTAEECFRRSVELAPERLQGHLDLLEYYRGKDDLEKAEHAARHLLQRFPDNAPAKAALAEFCMASGRYDEGLALFQEANRANPLDSGLRNKLYMAHVFHARPRVGDSRFDEARADYQAALALSDARADAAVLCLWAGCEFKAGATDQAEALLERARAAGAHPLGTAYRLLTAAVRWKLPRPLKTRFQTEFTTGLSEAPTAAAVAAILEAAAAQKTVGEDYKGEKAHEKKILRFVQKAKHIEFAEGELVGVCRSLLELEAVKPLVQFARLGQRRFPQSPFFHLLEAEAVVASGPSPPAQRRLRRLLDRAQQLAARLPESRRGEIVERIDYFRQLAGMADHLMDLVEFPEMFESFLDDFDDDEQPWRRRKPR